MKKLLLVLLFVILWMAEAKSREAVQPNDSINSEEQTRKDSFRASLISDAEKGDTEAMNYLGYLLLNGEEGFERDIASGLSWITKAATAGDVKAASNLGWLLTRGDIVEKNIEAGVKWLEKAAGDGLPVAQSLLGDLYLQGEGVPADSLIAADLYKTAFEHGLYDAGYKLYALMAPEYEYLTPEEKVKTGKYYYLRGAPSEGVKLFYMAADEGNPEAMALLGDAYSRALGVPYDHALSLKYFVQAASAGNPSAQFVLAELLDIFPDSLKGNEEWANISDNPFFWYEEAAKAGVTDAATATSLLLQQ